MTGPEIETCAYLEAGREAHLINAERLVAAAPRYDTPQLRYAMSCKRRLTRAPANEICRRIRPTHLARTHGRLARGAGGEVGV